MEQIYCDLIPGGKMPLLHASQYDEGREYRINLTENKQAYTLDGTELLTVSVRKGDNTLFTADIANTFGGKSYVDFVSTEQMCACAGFSFGELSIVKNNTRIGTINFTLMVEPSPEEGGVSQSEINNLARQVEELVDDEMGDYLLKTEAEETYATITDLETLSGVVDTKASKTYVDNAVSPKADKTYVDTQLSTKADKSDTYTKTQTDNLVSPKADKSYVDTQLASKANSADVYDKTETNNLLNAKANASDVYTKTETDNKITAIIDDTQVLVNKAWSSKKTFDEIANILPTGTASGKIATFNTSLAFPLKSIVVDNEATKVSVFGKNLASNLQNDGYVADRYLVESGAEWTPSTNPQNWFVTGYIRCPDELHFSCDSIGSAPSIVFYDIDKQYIRGVQYQNRTDFQITIPNNAVWFRASVNKTTNVQIEVGEQKTDYEAFNGVEYSISDIDNIISKVGVNNIFADSGDCDVVYRMSIEDYVNSLGGGLRSLGNSNENLSKGGGDTEEEPKEEPKTEVKELGDEPISKK